MGRPKKAINYDEEILRIESQITKWRNTIAELEEKRSALMAEKEQNELQVLHQVVQSTGMSVNEIVSLINGAERPQSQQ